MASRNTGTDSEQGNRLPKLTESDKERLLTDLLKDVSRAFYLTLRVLPGGLREPIGLAYLLARAADTIADTTLVPTGQRMEHLLGFRQQVIGPTNVDAIDTLMYSLSDKQTDSRWSQLFGRAIEGPMEGRRLEKLPSTMTSWGRWRQLHPNTTVYVKPTAYYTFASDLTPCAPRT